jgi:ribosomal protein S18 acetylase RimI-like enzyme
MELQIVPYDMKHPIPYELLMLADPSRKVIDSYFQRGYCFLAYLEETCVGEFVLLKTRPETVEIVNIAVDEAYQGQGIGKKLVYQAIDEARNLDAATIEIGTGNSSLKQLRLYQTCGFRITGVDIDFFVRHYDEDIIEDGIPCRDMIRLSLDIR